MVVFSFDLRRLLLVRLSTSLLHDIDFVRDLRLRRAAFFVCLIETVIWEWTFDFLHVAGSWNADSTKVRHAFVQNIPSLECEPNSESIP